MVEDLSPTMRDYLAEIYRLSDRNSEADQYFVSTSMLADLLDVSAPAVNRMVTRLKELGLLEHLLRLQLRWSSDAAAGIPTVIYGAGEAGHRLLQE
mgnify:CR=1 FL=1